MLWPHQARAVEMLQARPNCALFWEQGCGKTAPLVVAGQMVGGRQLWVTLASLRLQTAREVRRWRTDRPRMQVVLEGSDRIRQDAQVVIVSFDHMRMEKIWKQLFRMSWDVITVDEAHRLASRGARTTKAMYGARVTSKGALIRRAKHVWISTGTPIVNWPHEIWTHVSRLWPQLCDDAPTYDEWRDRFCHVVRSDYGEQIVGGKEPVELMRRLRQMGSRLRLEDCVDIPPLTVDQDTVAGKDVDLDAVDERVAHEVRVILARQEGEDWDPAMLEQLGSPVTTMRRLIAGAKAPAVAERVLEELAGGADRLLVFGCHVEPLQALHKHLQAEAVPTGLIIGATSPATRNQLLRDFDAGKLKVLVGNIQAMGTGLNMQACRRAIFLDASWSPAQNAQAIGRIYRAGQTRPCHVTFVSLAGSVDDNVQRVLARKARFIGKLEGWQ